jgi:hypothetical protein
VPLTNPRAAPTADQLRTLNDARRIKLLRETAPRPSQSELAALSDEIATAALWALLRPYQDAGIPVVDANDWRRNQPGYDFLVDDRVRIQLKSSSYLDCIGWAQKTGAAMEFDVLVFVDIGITMDKSYYAPLAPHRLPTRPCLDFYVIPQSVVAGWVAAPRYVTRRGVMLYSYARPVQPGTKEAAGQTHEIRSWRDRFDIIDDLVAVPV